MWNSLDERDTLRRRAQRRGYSDAAQVAVNSDVLREFALDNEKLTLLLRQVGAVAFLRAATIIDKRHRPIAQSVFLFMAQEGIGGYGRSVGEAEGDRQEVPLEYHQSPYKRTGQLLGIVGGLGDEFGDVLHDRMAEDDDVREYWVRTMLSSTYSHAPETTLPQERLLHDYFMGESFDSMEDFDQVRDDVEQALRDFRGMSDLIDASSEAPGRLWRTIIRRGQSPTLPSLRIGNSTLHRLKLDHIRPEPIEEDGVIATVTRLDTEMHTREEELPETEPTQAKVELSAPPVKTDPITPSDETAEVVVLRVGRKTWPDEDGELDVDRDAFMKKRLGIVQAPDVTQDEGVRAFEGLGGLYLEALEELSISARYRERFSGGMDLVHRYLHGASDEELETSWEYGDDHSDMMEKVLKALGSLRCIQPHEWQRLAKLDETDSDDSSFGRKLRRRIRERIINTHHVVASSQSENSA